MECLCLGVGVGLAASPLLLRSRGPALRGNPAMLVGVGLGVVLTLVAARLPRWPRRSRRPDAIVVPGGGQAEAYAGPTPPHMVARLDLAAKLYHAAQAPKPRIICLSGGTPHKPNPRDARGFDSKESTASARYLISEHDVPPADVLEEAFSLDTIGNAYFLRVWHTDVAGYRSLLVVNNAFHLPRTRAIFDHVFSLPAAPGGRSRGGRRYVSYAYGTDGCKRLDEDGACMRRSKRVVAAAVTVSLESQARTLEEQRRMDRGELEDRKIDTLWVVTCSAPEKGLDDAARAKLRAAADSFEVLVQDALPAAVSD